MKLLIVTQKVDSNDSTLGFFHEWILEFAKTCERVTVITLQMGEHHFPPNVHVLSLGKEYGISRTKYLFNFVRYVIGEVDHYTHVFVHMNPLYLVIAGWFWRLVGKKVSLWYVHRQVNMSLRIATFFSHVVFTAARESFGIKTPKVRIVGHGINVKDFEAPARMEHETARHSHGRFVLLTVGRITRIKNIETLIEAVALLRAQGFECACEIVGPKVTYDDQVYYRELKDLVNKKGIMHLFLFRDEVPAKYVREYYWRSDVLINLSPTGGIDKVVLEGIVGGALPLAANTAFTELFGNYAQELLFEYGNAQSLAAHIEAIYRKDRKPILHFLQKKIHAEFTVPHVIAKIEGELSRL